MVFGQGLSIREELKIVLVQVECFGRAPYCLLRKLHKQTGRAFGARSVL